MENTKLNMNQDILSNFCASLRNDQMSNDAKKRVQAAAQRPENQRCADCGCKLLTSSVWASSTLGIFVCINCSGRHRNLGTHITFIRSLTLDSWTDEQATVMENIGNEISNAYWEKNLPKDYNRPATDDLDGLTKFIRFKYELGKWADKGATPPNVLLKQGKMPKRVAMTSSNSAAPVAQNHSNHVHKSNSTATIIDLGTPNTQQMHQSSSTDLFATPPPSPMVQQTPAHLFGFQQPSPSPVTQQFGQPMPGFGQSHPTSAFGFAQPQPQPQQFNPFGQPQVQQPQGFNPFGAQPQVQQPMGFGQPMQPQQDARSALKSMLQSAPSAPQSSGTAVFRQPGFQPQPSAARAQFMQQPIRSGPANAPPRPSARDAFSGISPF